MAATAADEDEDDNDQDADGEDAIEEEAATGAVEADDVEKMDDEEAR